MLIWVSEPQHSAAQFDRALWQHMLAWIRNFSPKFHEFQRIFFKKIDETHQIFYLSGPCHEKVSNPLAKIDRFQPSIGSLTMAPLRYAQIFIKTNKSALKCTNSGDFDCPPFSAPPYYWHFSSKKPQNQQKTWKHIEEKKMIFMFPTNMIRIPLFWKSWPLQ